MRGQQAVFNFISGSMDITTQDETRINSCYDPPRVQPQCTCWHPTQSSIIQIENFVVRSSDYPGLPDDALLFAQLVRDGHAIEQTEPVSRTSRTQNTHGASWTSWFPWGLWTREPVESVWGLKGNIEVPCTSPLLTISIIQQNTAEGTRQLCSIELTDADILNQPAGQKLEVTWKSGGDDDRPSLKVSFVISVMLQSPTISRGPTGSGADDLAFPGEQYAANLPHRISTAPTIPVSSSVDNRLASLLLLKQILDSDRPGLGVDPDVIAFLHKQLLLWPDMDKRATYLNGLGDICCDRYLTSHNIDDLNWAVSIYEDAVLPLPDSHPKKGIYMSDLASSLSRRFDCLGDIGDLHKSNSVSKDAMRLIPDGHPAKPGCLANLGVSFLSRFQRLGDPVDIDRSISMFEDAVWLTPDSHPDKPNYLSNLGASFIRRFERFGDPADIDKSILMKEDAVRLTPDGHPDKPVCLNNLGNSFSLRFERYGDFADFEKSILMQEDVVQLTPDGHPDKPGRLNNLGNSFLSRFERFRDRADIDMSISMFEDAVRLTPNGHPDKPSYLNNLGNSFSLRFERFDDLANIDKSISIFEDAVRLTPDGHPRKPLCLRNLGNSFFHRFARFDDLPALAKAISRYSMCANSSTGPPSIRFWASSYWASCAMICNHPSLQEAYTVALNLLPQLAWLGLPMEDRHRELVNASQVVSDAAAFAIESGLYETAIEWLEQGRSVVWGQLLQLRTPVDDLYETRPDLASQFAQLSNHLEKVSSRDPLADDNNQMSMEQIAQRHRRLTSQWEELVKDIRALPGFDRFLLPKKRLQLTSGACSGPLVLLNINEFRCDALILMLGLDVQHLPLPGFTLEKAQGLQGSLNALLSQTGRCISSDRAATLVHVGNSLRDTNAEFERILSELWFHVAKPVLDILGFTTPPTGPTSELSRIWWCPTGPLAFLPIHAAGVYDTTKPGSKLSEFCVSSYTPTLSALLDTPKRTPPQTFQLLAVAQPSTPEQIPLPGTREELKRIENRVGVFGFRSLEGSDATVEGVVSSMKESTWVHFSCHGVQDVTNPTESGLILGDGRLKLSDIIRMSLPHADLAFLSACQTATGAEKLSEEAVHLAGGMLLAGYRGVIATMWSIMDRDAPQVADDVYAHLFKEKRPDHTRAAHALHYAVQRLRESPEGKSYLSWVPFIHIGV